MPDLEGALGRPPTTNKDKTTEKNHLLETTNNERVSLFENATQSYSPSLVASTTMMIPAHVKNNSEPQYSEPQYKQKEQNDKQAAASFPAAAIILKQKIPRKTR